MQTLSFFQHTGQIMGGLSEISSDNLPREFGFSERDLHCEGNGGMIIPSTVNIRKVGSSFTVVPFSVVSEGTISIDQISEDDLSPFY